VHDLLDPDGPHRALKVREHQILGPYVDELTKSAVTSYEVSQYIFDRAITIVQSSNTPIHSDSLFKLCDIVPTLSGQSSSLTSFTVVFAFF
jgi:hypothetical protein